MLDAVKLLLLGNSNDTGDWFEGGPKRHEILRDRLAAEFGEPVEVVAKSLWPNEKMVPLINRWLDETEFDAVYMGVTSFPFAFESLPLRLKRILGRLGPSVGDAGLRFSGSKRWSHNAVFRTLRRWGQATVGGDTHVTCDEAVDRFSEVIRVIIRRESTLLIVKGPTGRAKTGITGREHRRKEAKRLRVHGALESLCDQLHVHYIGRDTPLWRESQGPRGTKIGDGLHSNARGHAYAADTLVAHVRDAWAAHLERRATGEG
jgi:hypothetical protein